MEKETIEKRIEKLKESTPATFGIMTPQHMIEHLAITVRISYGKIKLQDFEPTEKQLAQKQALIYTDLKFPKGIKAPGLEENLLALRYPNLETAKSELLKSIDDYNSHFKTTPNDKTTHPWFGKLTHEEWEKFHPKHFNHHLKQFDL